MPNPDADVAERSIRPQGVDRLVMILGMALANWARNRADEKATARTRHPLSGLSDHERVELYREATELRDRTYAGRTSWHVIG